MNPPPFDREAAVKSFGSEAVLKEASSVYLEEFDSMMARISTAVGKRDYPELKEAAHWVKGGLVYLHAKPAAGAAKALEELAKQEQADGLDDNLAILRAEMARLREALALEV